MPLNTARVSRATELGRFLTDVLLTLQAKVSAVVCVHLNRALCSLVTFNGRGTSINTGIEAHVNEAQEIIKVHACITYVLCMYDYCNVIVPAQICRITVNTIVTNWHIILSYTTKRQLIL